MKSKLHLLFFLALFISFVTNAQTSASTAGIAVQGIARDNNNTARANESLSLTFEIYHKEASVEEQISTETITLQTDAFGVFSHVIDPTFENNANFANHQAYLRISEGSVIISDEKLKHVPYAIAANNGVPTGSIMPYIGATAPPGWVLCNGQSLTSIIGAQALIALVGSNNAPNLQGLFLRGTGTSPVSNDHVGPALKEIQGDSFKEHSHDDGTLKTTKNGNHDHDDGKYNSLLHEMNGDDTVGDALDFTRDEVNLGRSVPMKWTGEHIHDIEGSTGVTGGNETRPINYGVNYIIKL